MIALLALIILTSGIRFSDGSILLAIARGAGIADPVFANPLHQYLWDSPLKVHLLRALPAHMVVIALAFLVFSFLPLAMLFAGARGLVDGCYYHPGDAGAARFDSHCRCR